MKISVIVTCFNDGEFLTEALESALYCDEYAPEIIVVNDGSTDPLTLSVLGELETRSIKILSHTNRGLAFSRNRGIAAAGGEYILPLDADNRIRPDYVKKAVKLLDDDLCDIVYAQPFFFGEHIPEREFKSCEFAGPELLKNNYIDACAIFRKKVWEAAGGYDGNMPFRGNEDWELWLNSYFNGFRFKFIDEELFDYRIRANSMISEVSTARKTANIDYMLVKHRDAVIRLIDKGVCYEQFYKNDQRNYLRTTLKYLRLFFKNL